MRRFDESNGVDLRAHEGRNTAVLWRRFYKIDGQVQGQVGRLNPAGPHPLNRAKPIDRGIFFQFNGHDAEP